MKRRNSAGSLMVTLLIPVAIAINMVGGQMTSVLSLPIALDMIGVLLVGALAGTVPAVITAVLTNLLNGMLDPSWIPYVICSFFIGLTIGLLAKCNMMNRIWKAAICHRIFLRRDQRRRFGHDYRGPACHGAAACAVCLFGLHRNRAGGQADFHLCRVFHYQSNLGSYAAEIPLWQQVHCAENGLRRQL